MRLSDLVRDDVKPERMSHTKVWTHIANAAATAAFLRADLSEGLLLVYVGVVAGSHIASRVLSQRATTAAASDHTFPTPPPPPLAPAPVLAPGGTTQ